VTQSLVTPALAELAATARPGPAERDRARLLLADYLAVAGTGAGAGSARVARDALLPRSAGRAPVLGTAQTAAFISLEFIGFSVSKGFWETGPRGARR